MEGILEYLNCNSTEKLGILTHLGILTNCFCFDHYIYIQGAPKKLSYLKIFPLGELDG